MRENAIALTAPAVTAQRPWVVVGRWLIAALILAAAAVMVSGAFSDPALSDLAYLLAAGRLWSAGLDPYAPAFLIHQAGVLPPDAIGFVYPPTWWVLAVPLAQLPPAQALVAWKAFNMAAVLLSVALFGRLQARVAAPCRPWLMACFTVVLLTSNIMGEALRLGQTSLLMLLGFAILLTGLSEQRRGLQAAGLVILMLKPQFGLLFLALMSLRQDTRRAALIAFLVTAAGCLPILLLLGPQGAAVSVRHLLANLAAYQQSPWNAADATSGLGHLTAPLGLMLSPVLALASAGALAMWLIRSGRVGDEQEDVRRFWLASTAAILGLVPLHAYDFVFFFPCLLLLPNLDRRARPFALLALVLLLSAGLPVRLAIEAGLDLEGQWQAYLIKYDLLAVAGLALLAAAILDRRRETVSA